MIILDATSKSLEVKLAAAVTTTELPVTAHYVDVTTTTYTAAETDAVTTGTTAVTAVAAPSASTQRLIKLVTIYNADSAPALVTVQRTTSGTARILCRILLMVGASLVYTDGERLRVLSGVGSALGGTT